MLASTPMLVLAGLACTLCLVRRCCLAGARRPGEDAPLLNGKPSDSVEVDVDDELGREQLKEHLASARRRLADAETRRDLLETKREDALLAAVRTGDDIVATKRVKGKASRGGLVTSSDAPAPAPAAAPPSQARPPWEPPLLKEARSQPGSRDATPARKKGGAGARPKKEAGWNSSILKPPDEAELARAARAARAPARARGASPACSKRVGAPSAGWSSNALRHPDEAALARQARAAAEADARAAVTGATKPRSPFRPQARAKARATDAGTAGWNGGKVVNHPDEAELAREARAQHLAPAPPASKRALSPAGSKWAAAAPAPKRSLPTALYPTSADGPRAGASQAWGQGTIYAAPATAPATEAEAFTAPAADIVPLVTDMAEMSKLVDAAEVGGLTPQSDAGRTGARPPSCAAVDTSWKPKAGGCTYSGVS